jgi:hypothetical protein
VRRVTLRTARLTVVAGLLAVIVLALAAPAANTAGARPQAGGFNGDQIVTARYEGTEDDTMTGSPVNFTGVSYGVYTTHVQWDLTWKGTINDLEHGNADYWKIGKMIGTVTRTFPKTVLGAKGCTAKLSAVKGLKLLVGGGRSPDRQQFDLGGQAPFSADDWVSSDTNPADECSGGGNAGGGSINGPGGSDAQSPRIEFTFGGRTSQSKRFDANYIAKTSGGAFNVRDILKSTLTVAFGKVLPVPPADEPTTPGAVRAAAITQLIGIDKSGKLVPSKLGMALGPCLTVVAGAGIFVGGGLFYGVPAGTVIVIAATPFCIALVKSIVGLVDVLDDPPDPRIGVVAAVPRPSALKLSLPACPASPATKAQACATLEANLGSYVAAGQSFAAVVSTLATTVNRESAAAKAKNGAALAKQQKAALALLPTLSASSATLSSAGRALAAILRTAGVTAKLSRARAAQAISVVVRRVVAGGVSEAKLRSIAGKALAPRPFDAITALG